ncbi:undecaprenyl-phosphate glucose phosphotransferase, partial [Rhizobium leguminosarum]|nr:undecaprenyl-phosphate glucose phosphotransferase [Rhizobium ruizarguesonis]
MSQPNTSEQFNMDDLRKKVSEIRAGDEAPDQAASTVLNPFARQIAEQFRDQSTSPAMLIGQLRLAELAGLLLIG